MTEEEKRVRSEKLSLALAGLAKGENPDGTPIDFAVVAAKTGAAARRFAENLRLGQARTQQKIRESGIRFKG